LYIAVMAWLAGPAPTRTPRRIAGALDFFQRRSFVTTSVKALEHVQI